MSSRLAPHLPDAAALVDELARLRIVESERLTGLLAEFGAGSAEAFGEYLVSRGVLTPFQAESTLGGKTGLVALGPYRLTSSVGPGTFGQVYLATHRNRPGEVFSVQVFPLRSLWRAKQAKRLARSLAKSPHPCVVPTTEADSANGYHFLTWPYVSGVSLADRVAKSGPLKPSEVVDLLAPLADALRVCHAHPIAHGALTPRTVLLASDGAPRILELGAGTVLALNLAENESFLDTMSVADASTGVLVYAAPEYAADPVPTPAADQYALGAVGYFALTGHSPFPDMPLHEQLAAKLSGSPRPLNEVNATVPVELAALVNRMLSPKPADRFAILADVYEELNRLAALLAQPDPVTRQTTETPPEPQATVVDYPRGNSRRAFHGSLFGSTATTTSRRDDTEDSINFDVAASPSVAHPKAVSPVLTYPVDTPTRSTVDAEPPPQLCLATTDSTSPQPRTSPKSDVPQMAKLSLPPQADPRKGVGLPVHYHTQSDSDLSDLSPPAEEPILPSNEPPRTGSFVWKKLKSTVLFWQAPSDVVQVSVFGPSLATPGQPGKVTVYLHSPADSESIRTLSRAFHHDTELIGYGYANKEVRRDTELAIHLSVANAGVTRSLQTFRWRGQPQRLVFDLHIPWEAPSGLAPGLVSVGRDNVRIGKITFHLRLRPREG